MDDLDCPSQQSATQTMLQVNWELEKVPCAKQRLRESLVKLHQLLHILEFISFAVFVAMRSLIAPIR